MCDAPDCKPRNSGCSQGYDEHSLHSPGSQGYGHNLRDTLAIAIGRARAPVENGVDREISQRQNPMCDCVGSHLPVKEQGYRKTEQGQYDENRHDQYVAAEIDPGEYYEAGKRHGEAAEPSDSRTDQNRNWDNLQS